MDVKGAAKGLSEELQNALNMAERERKAFILAPENVDGLAASAMLLKFLVKKGFRPSIRFFGTSQAFSQIPGAGLAINLGGPEDACKGCVSVKATIGSHGLPLPFSSLVVEALNELGEAQTWAYRIATIGFISAMADLGNGRKFLEELSVISEAAERANAISYMNSLELPFGHLLPLYDSLNISVDPYLKGLTGNQEACISILKELSMLTVGKERHTTLKDLTNEQLSALLGGLEKYSQGDLKRTVYYDPLADESSVFWNYRDIALFLEVLLLKGMSAKAFQTIVGLGGATIEDDWGSFVEQLKGLVKTFNAVINNKERMLEEAGALRVVTTGLVGARETAQFIKWLSLQKEYRERIIVGETNAGSDEVLITFLKGKRGEQLIETAKKYGGKAVVYYPFILFYVNVIKAGLLYNEIIKVAGVP